MKPTGRKGVSLALIGASVLLLGAAAVILLTRQDRPAGPRPAPESDAVRSAQASLPFQVLVPAFLPDRFIRESVILRSGLAGPDGEPMFELVYRDRSGGQLVLHEWVPAAAGRVSFAPAAAGGGQASECGCGCPACAGSATAVAGASSATGAAAGNPFQIDRDRLRVLAGVTSPYVLNYQELQAVLGTLAPAAGLTAYSTLEEVPLAETVPPAVPVETNAAGVQELVLVVAPDGYKPAHFSVKRGVPVRIIFRQLGYVGCGNELEIDWRPALPTLSTLESPNDSEVIDITPDQTGDFSYHCPHSIYRGVMTVTE